MILTADYHIHTPYSHGKQTVDENTARAKELGLKEIAISDHGFSHIAFGLRRRKLEDFIADCKAATEKYGIKVLVGTEANLRGIEGKSDLTEKDFEKFDTYFCGTHVMVWYDGFSNFWKYGAGNFCSRKFKKQPSQKRIEINTRAYINAIKNNPIDAITHLNYLCPSNALEVAKCAADYGTYIELNSKKEHLTDEELNEIIQKTDVRFIVDSDAHSVDRVGDTKRVEEQLARLNFPFDRIDNIDGRLPAFRFTEFKKKL